MSSLLTIGEVARRSGVAASALRFYEDRGLIKSERAGSGHRRFPRAVLRRIAFVVSALVLVPIAGPVAQAPGGKDGGPSLHTILAGGYNVASS
jgi:MerR family redox-sensitive transcriptional activator SoxR